MKKINVLILGVLALFAITACNNSSGNAEELSEKVEVKKDVAVNTETSFEVEGMVCSMGCAAVIQKELNALNGVAIAEVSFENESAVVKYDRRTITEEELIAAIANVGDHIYSATVLETKSNLDSEVEEVDDVLNVVRTTKY